MILKIYNIKIFSENFYIYVSINNIIFGIDIINKNILFFFYINIIFVRLKIHIVKNMNLLST